MTSIKCVIERITYQNPENGYCVLKVKATGFSDLVTIVGILLDIRVGTVIEADGNWKIEKKYGNQFVVSSWREVLPSTAYGLEKYLGSGLIKGVGPKYAHRIVEKFGLESIDIIENNIDELKSIQGIGRKMIEKIRKSWHDQKEIRNVMVFLQGYDISPAYAIKIYREYGDESMAKVKENPYRLADDIWGIGFKTADKIASKLGYGEGEYMRIRSGVAYSLGELSNDGHVYAERDQIVQTASELLGVNEDIILPAIGKMIDDKDLIQEDDSIYLPPFYYAEIGVANRIKSLIAIAKNEPKYGINIDSVKLATNIEFNEQQSAAISLAINSKIMVLTGGPGTGKTTATCGIIEVLKQCGHEVILAAPTGRAAKRLSEVTGIEAKTIHSMLEYRPVDGFMRNEKNPLDGGDVLIVDECSMVDILLMNALLKAMPDNMKLILVGDVDQLPSVGPGNVLRDIINSKAVPVVRLTEIFRQAQASRIIMNAHRVNNGTFPDLSNGLQSDFFFMCNDNQESVVADIVNLVKDRLPKAYNVKPQDVQVLVPMRRGIVGTSNLNLKLQSELNPSTEFLARGGYTFRLGDKVMQIRNNYDKNVYNGDIGIVCRIDKENDSLSVDYYDSIVEYDVSELDEITLAYATTIHKSQGSEYPIVVIPFLMSHYVMLQRNLLYTAITRAKKICILIGEKKAVYMAIKKTVIDKRNSKLQKRLETTDVSCKLSAIGEK